MRVRNCGPQIWPDTAICMFFDDSQTERVSHFLKVGQKKIGVFITGKNYVFQICVGKYSFVGTTTRKFCCLQYNFFASQLIPLEYSKGPELSKQEW